MCKLCTAMLTSIRVLGEILKLKPQASGWCSLSNWTTTKR